MNKVLSEVETLFFAKITHEKKKAEKTSEVVEGKKTFLYRVLPVCRCRPDAGHRALIPYMKNRQKKKKSTNIYRVYIYY